MFVTDLMRKVQRPLTMDFMSVSSYSGAESSGFVRIDSDHKTNIYGWDVILIDDIVDTGYTIYTVKKLLQERKPKSLRVCALLDKVERHKVEIEIDYCGFKIPDYFVVGYGLDIDEKGRNLPVHRLGRSGKVQKVSGRKRKTMQKNGLDGIYNYRAISERLASAGQPERGSSARSRRPVPGGDQPGHAGFRPCHHG